MLLTENTKATTSVGSIIGSVIGSFVVALILGIILGLVCGVKYKERRMTANQSQNLNRGHLYEDIEIDEHVEISKNVSYDVVKKL